MGSIKSYKVAIIGAGIVGTYLGWKLSEAGHKVSIFEKRKEIWQKPCSGLISERIKQFVPLPASLIENKIDFTLIHFPRKTVRLILRPPHYVISHKKLNDYLSKKAEAEGVKFFFGRDIQKVPEEFDKVIGADGALSKIRDELLLPRPRFRLGLQITFEKEDFSHKVETWPTDEGFFWKIPRGKVVEYGAILSLEKGKKYFERFCKQQGIELEGREIKAALIPEGLIVPNDNSITLCGDAAGLTKPWSGGGIIWGLTAADILLKSFPDFREYQKELRRFFSFKIFKGRIVTNLVYFLGSRFPYVLPSEVSRDNDFPLI